MAETSSDSNLPRSTQITTPVQYRHSGELGRAPLFFLAAGVALYVAPCYAYGLVSSGIMYVKFKILITILLGGALGWATAWLARVFCCRSLFFVTLVAVIGAFAGMYVGIAVFMESVFAMGPGPIPPQCRASAMIGDPLHWWNMLNLINGSGYYSNYNKAVTGMSLRIDWAFEGVPFFPTAVALTYTTFRAKPYCETCKKWLDLKKASLRFELPTSTEILERLKTGDLSAMAQLAQFEPHETVAAYIRLDYVLCNLCGNMGTYRIVSVGTGHHGAEENSSNLMLMTPETMPMLAALLAREKTDKGAA